MADSRQRRPELFQRIVVERPADIVVHEPVRTREPAPHRPETLPRTTMRRRVPTMPRWLPPLRPLR